MGINKFETEPADTNTNPKVTDELREVVKQVTGSTITDDTALVTDYISVGELTRVFSKLDPKLRVAAVLGLGGKELYLNILGVSSGRDHARGGEQVVVFHVFPELPEATL